MRRALQTNEKSFICLPTEQGMRLVRPCQHDEELLAIQTFVLQRVMSILCRIGCDHGSWLRSALLEEFLLFRLVLRPASKGPKAHEGEGTARWCCSWHVSDSYQYLSWMKLLMSVFLSPLAKATNTPLSRAGTRHSPSISSCTSRHSSRLVGATEQSRHSSY